MANVYDAVSDFEEIISKYVEIGHIDEKGDTMVKCPFPGHKETKGSFSINVKNGVYHCFGCSAKGNILTLVKEMEGLASTGEANDFILRYYGKSEAEPIKRTRAPAKKQEKATTAVIPPDIIHGYVKELREKRPDLIQRMMKEWGITEQVLNDYEIGFDGDRITIPIKDDGGAYANIRRYKFNPPDGIPKVISYDKGYGEGRLWPLQNLLRKDVDYVWLCEGEKDCISALSRGLNAVTGTAGASTFKNEWAEKFEGKRVFIVYDNDDAGKLGAGNVALKLKDHAALTKNIILPVPNEKEDLSDYFNKYNHTVEELWALEKAIGEDKFSDVESVDMSFAQRIPLGEASRAQYFNKAIEVECLVIGLGELYMPPKKVKVSCKGGFEKCKYCKVMNDGEESGLVIEYKPNQGKILNLIDVTDAQQMGWIKRDLNIHDGCRITVTKLETFNIEEIAISPKLDFTGDHTPVNVKAYYIGQGLETNKTYLFRGYTIAEPKHNYATQVLIEARPDQESLKDFHLKPQDILDLDIFKARMNPDAPTDFSSIEEKMADITRMMECNITRIWGRDYVHHAIDLVYHSPLSFMFGGEDRVKGWMDILIVGDPRTGKNNILEGMMKYYGMGIKASAEAMSFAGLLAGQDVELGIVKWGIIPQNDGRLVAIDELSGLATQIIAQLSSARDKGECTYVKSKQSSTLGRTRLICLSNPRGEGAHVKDFPYGVNVIKPLIGNNEDVARFDYALVLSNEDVSADEINKIHDEVVEVKYPAELCKRLIQWCWSRRKSEVIIDRPAIMACLQCAKNMSKRYSSTVPLVLSEDIRFKIAKIAAAYALRTFNTYDKDARNVIVEARHVYLAEKFLKTIYDKPAMAYDGYSYIERASNKIGFEPDLKELMSELAKQDMFEVFYTKMVSQENEVFSANDLSLMIGEYEAFKRSSREVMSLLARANAIKRTPSGHYKKTPAFIKWLNNYVRKLNDGGNNVNLDLGE